MSSRVSSYSSQKMSGLLHREIDELEAYNSVDTLRKKEKQEMILQISSPSTPYQRIFPSQEKTSKRAGGDFIKIVDAKPVQSEKTEEVESYKKEILELRSRILELEDKFKGMDGNQTCRSQVSKGGHYKSSSVYENPSSTLYNISNIGLATGNDFLFTNKGLKESLAKSAVKAQKRGASAVKSRSYRYQSDSDESTSDGEDLEFELEKYRRMTRENIEKNDPTKKHRKKRQLLKQEIKQLNQEYDEDKALLIKERVKGQELAEKIRKTQRTLDKMEQKLLKASRIEGDFKRLFDSFSKSENIRDHQTSLIRHLTSQVHSSWVPSSQKKTIKKKSK